MVMMMVYLEAFCPPFFEANWRHVPDWGLGIRPHEFTSPAYKIYSG